MALDARGDISIFVIAIYVPILCISLYINILHGFTRKAGWLFLLILSLTRIIGAALHIAAEEVRPINTGLYIGYSVLEPAGLSPLLIATTSFLSTIAERAFDHDGIVRGGLRLMHLLGLLTFVLTIVSGTESSGSNVSVGTTLRHVAVIMYAVLYLSIALLHSYFWINKSQIMMHRRTLLLGISAALPFLLVRVVYSVLGGFAPIHYGPPSPDMPNNFFTKFSSVGPWEYYLGMGVLMELAAVIIYIVTGLKTPLGKDYYDPSITKDLDDTEAAEIMLGGHNKQTYSDGASYRSQ